MEEDDFDYKFAYEQHFGAISSESGSENEEEFLRLYGNYEPLPVPIDPNNIIIVPPDELLKEFEHQVDKENSLSSSGHIDEEGFITVGVKTMKNRSRNMQSLQFSTNPTKREEVVRQSDFSRLSTNRSKKNMIPQKKRIQSNRQTCSTWKIHPKKKLIETHITQSNKQKHKPNKDEFPVISSSSNNMSRPKEKMLSISKCVPSQSKTEAEVNILSNPEVFNTNQKYVGTVLEEVTYNPIMNTTTIPSLVEIEFDTSNNVVKTQNEASYPEYIRTDIFMQNEMKFKNEDTTKGVDSLLFDSNKSSITNIGTAKSTGAKKKKSKNKQNNVPNTPTFQFKEDDFPVLSSSTGNVSRPKKMLSNQCQIGPKINIPKDQEVSNTNQEYVTVGTILEEISYKPIINTTTIPSLMDIEFDTSNDAVKTENKLSYSIDCTPEYIRTDSDLCMQNEMKFKSEDTKKYLDGLFFDKFKSFITYVGKEKSTGAKKKKSKSKQNYIPNTPTFKYREDDFPNLCSSTSNVGRPKKKMLSNQCQIGAETNIPKDQEVSNTNQEYGTVGKFLEMGKISYSPIINKTTIPSPMEIEFNTSNNAVKPQNEASYSINYTPGNSRTESSDPFMQNEIKSENEKGVDSLLFDSNKSSIINIGTAKSTGAKKNKSKSKKQEIVETSITVEEHNIETLESISQNKQNHVPNTPMFKFKEVDFPNLSSSTSNVSKPKEEIFSNQCQIGPEINILKAPEVSNTNQEDCAVETFLKMERSSYCPTINTTTNPSLMEMEFNTSNNVVKHPNELPYSMNCNPGNSASDPFMQNEIKSTNEEDTTKDVDSLLFDKSFITNIGTEKPTKSKRKKSKNKNQKNVETSVTVEEHKIEILESIFPLNNMENKVFTGNSLMHKMSLVSENVMTEIKSNLINNRVHNYFDFGTLLSTLSDAHLNVLLSTYIRHEVESLKIISEFIKMKNVVILSPVTAEHCVEITKGNKLKVNFSGNNTIINAPQNIVKADKTELQLVNNMMEVASFNYYKYYYDYYINLKAEKSAASYTSIQCKTLENTPQSNDLQKVVIADFSPIANDHEISWCVELTEENKLKTDSNGNNICFNDPQVPKNIAMTTKTDLQLVSNMMQDATFNYMYNYGYYSNLKAEECVATCTAIERKTSKNISQLNEMQNVAMTDNLRIGKPNFNVSQDCECVEKLPKRKLNFINNPVLDASNYDNYTHIELEDNIAKNNVPYERDCDTNMSIKELTTKVNSTAIVNIREIGVNTDDELTSTNLKMSRRTCDVGVNTSRLVTTKNVCVNTTQQQSFQTVEPNPNISISDIFDKFIELTRCDNEMPPSLQLALQLTIILLMIQIFLSLTLWALDNSVVIFLILYGFYFNQ